MDSVILVVWVPIIVILFAAMQQMSAARGMVIRVIKKKKGRVVMQNELIKKFVGKECRISTGAMGVKASGKIVQVNENWIEVQTKKGSEVINLDFIQYIKLK